MAENILAAIDFSDVTDAVLAQTRRLAKAFGAKIWLTHIEQPKADSFALEEGAEARKRLSDEQLGHDHGILMGHCRALRDSGFDVQEILVEGEPVERIIEAAETCGSDLIVLGSHGHGKLYHLLMGGTAENVLHKCSCPVVVVPSRAARRVENPAPAPAPA